MHRAGHRRRSSGLSAGRTAALALLVPAAGLFGARAGADEPDAGLDAGATAAPVADYAPVAAWNGLGRFAALAHDLGITLEFTTLDRLRLDPAETVLIVFPDRAPDGAALRDFVAAGGRLLVADDFGLGGAALAPLGVLRVAAPATTSSAFRGDPDLPIAVPAMRHPALDGVGAVVTNHPAALGAGAGGRCLLAFLAPPPACVLAEVDFGYGEALALVDPSVLIDLMLQVDGNRRLAQGLLRYLTANRLPRVIVVLPADAWATVQPLPPEGAGARAALRRVLARIAEPLAAAPPWCWVLFGAATLLWAAAGRIRTPARADFAPPRLLHAERPGPATAYPAPERREAWVPFAQEAVDVMHAAVTRRLAAAADAMRPAGRADVGWRARLRLRLERRRLAALQRRLRACGDDAAGAPGCGRLDRLAADFFRDGRIAP